MGDQSSFYSAFLIGGIVKGLFKSAVAPLERVKLLLQTQDANKVIQEGKVKRYNGMVNCFTRVIKEEGMRALWRGNLANIIRYFPVQLLHISFDDAFKRHFRLFGIFIQYIDPKTDFVKYFIVNILTGGLVGAISLLFVYPLDFGRTRLAADIGKNNDRQFKGLYDCLKQIAKSDGPLGLYRGYVVSVFGIMAYRGIYFGLYDIFHTTNQTNNIFLNFFSAYAIATSTGLLTYPLDTVRVRMMMQSGRADVIYSSTIDCFKQIRKREGLRGFYKGGFTNIITSISSSVILMMYQQIS